MTNPKVSIIIPVYNGSNYLREAIDSALGQSYPNVEVIIVNDGSTDNGATEQIALSYGNRIRYYPKENGGVSTALNYGIEKMTGDYFSWLSHDDVYYPNKIYNQIKFLMGNDLKDTILYGGYELIDESSMVRAQIKPENLYPEVKLNIPLFPIFRGLINGCSLLIHKSHFQKSGLFDENLQLAQDYALWFKMLRNAKIKFLPGISVKTRIHNEQQSSVKKDRNLNECNSIWISFMNEVSVQEMCEMDGSPYVFYKKTANFLQKFTSYTEAQQYAESLAQKAKDKISVVIPFLNRIPALIESIKSVLAQSYTNIEVLLIDDGSTDDITPLKELEDPRLRYINQEHKGTSAARNLGISLSLGEYIAFLDSDDIFLPGKLEKQINYMKTYKLPFSHTSYLRMNMQGKPKQLINSGRFSGKVFPRILASCGIAASTVMVKREVLDNMKFKESIILGEDVCLWIDIAYSNTIGGIDEPLTSVRIGSTSSVFDIEKQRIAYLNIVEHIIKNPLYVVNEHEINLLLKDFTNLFKL
ncbi:glycosyltransferase [Desulfitobacterium sp. Sab5]|uniref:glycosyltransferase family 2 protein n=1 Tax=Desulfitobacterium nosdiversum TaxID=3375356 RepID=UPI003CE77B24